MEESIEESVLSWSYLGSDLRIHDSNACSDSPPPRRAPLVLTGAIPLPTVKGRIDHFGFDPAHNRLFLSALGNNTEEIIGIGPQTVVHTISGVPTPQGVAYSPETNKLFVGSDEGTAIVDVQLQKRA